MRRYQVAIIGGGAAGLMCAMQLVDHGAKDVVILERNDRVGKKLSATGNGQGNVTNANVTVANYFTDDPSRLGKTLAAFDNCELVAYLESKGGLFLSDKSGKVYPASKQGSSVTDLLRGYLAGKAEILLNQFVTDITAQNGGYRIRAQESVWVQNVVIATGGKAQKNFGSDGNGYELVKKLGHTLTPLYPSLVQLKTDPAFIKTLKGIRAEARVSTLYKGKKVSASGDVIFTDYGISGNAVFSISPYLTQEGGEVSIEFLPSVEEEKLVQLIRNKRASRPDIEDGELLSCLLNNQIGRAIVKRAQTADAGKIAALVKNFTLPVRGTLGFDYAQVTKGGVPLGEVSDGMESKCAKNLFLVGEIVNVDGECGGYNLQWAFSSACAAAREIAKRLAKS